MELVSLALLGILIVISPGLILFWYLKTVLIMAVKRVS